MDDAIKLVHSKGQATLPSYKNPPVNEVVFGILYRTPSELKLPHIGILWQKFQSDYPYIQHAPPIASAKGELKIDSKTGVPIPRLWFINESDDQLIQFQVDRFYFNWRRRQDNYPRYDYLKNKFVNLLDNMIIFFDELNFGNLEPIQCELTYINHIPKGEIWNRFDDLTKIFSDFAWSYKKDRFLPNPQKIAWQCEFALPEGRGRLVAKLKQAIRTEDKVPLLVLELQAIGIYELNGKVEKEYILSWFDLAREWIVRGFTDLTTPETHEIWGKE